MTHTTTITRRRLLFTRTVWATVGGVFTLLAAYYVAALGDTRDADRVEQVSAAYRAGWNAGANDVGCWGVQYDKRTGKGLQ